MTFFQGDDGTDIFSLGLGDSADGAGGNDTFLITAITTALPLSQIIGGTGTDTLDARNVFAGGTYMFFTDLEVSGSLDIPGFRTTGIETFRLSELGANYFIFQTAPSAITVYGGGFDDVIVGGANFADIFYGGGGADRIQIRNGDHAYGEDGADVFELASGSSGLIDGGAGSDILSVSFGANVDLGAGTAMTPTAAMAASLVSVENVRITAMAGYTSYLFGDEGANSFAVTSDAFQDDGRAGVVFDGRGGDDILTGSAGADTLNGGEGNDLLDGRAGADSLTGGAGNDRYFIDNIGDTVTEYAGEGDDEVVTGLDTYTLAPNVENLTLTSTAYHSHGVGNALNNAITGNENGNSLYGYAGDDILRGMGGDDRLAGYDGNNWLIGGTGDDFYVVASAGDRVEELADEGQDTLLASVSYELSAGAEIEFIYASSGPGDVWPPQPMPLELIGNEFRQIITGNEVANVLSGMGGNDTLRGGLGNDTLIGGTGDDSLNGGSGADLMLGGTGEDSYIVDNVGDRVVEMPGEGQDTILTTINYSLARGNEVEVLTAYDEAASDALRLTGNELAQRIFGNAGTNLLDSGGGSDHLFGWAGDDSYFVHGSGEQVVELAGRGNDTVYAFGDFALGSASEVETITAYDRSSVTTINLTGNELANRIIGNAGTNSLRSGGGADVMYGLGGDDSYVVESAAAQVIETVGGGNDTVYTLGSFGLANGVEVETLTIYDRATTNAANLSGNAFTQRIIGNAGTNLLDSGGGADLLYGLAGDEAYFVRGGGEQVVELAGGGNDTVYAFGNFTLGARSEVETITAYDRSSVIAISLTGNELANRIIGNAGTNSLRSGGGADVMYGLGGDDSYVIEGTGAQVIETVGGGNDTVYTIGSYSVANGMEVETLTIYDRATTNAVNLSGNEFTQRIIGNAGKNLLDAGGSTGVLYGLTGDDTYLLRTPGARVIELAGQGYDTVLVATGAGAISDFTLAAGVSVEVLAAHNETGRDPLRLTGNELSQTIYGNAANNVLNGGGGADILSGLDGDDSYIVDTDDQVIELGGGNDTVYALSSFKLAADAAVETLTVYDRTTTNALDLAGSAAANRIIGNAGANVLDGKEGADTLYGLDGADTFVFSTLLGPNNVDTIVGFTSGSDRIQLSTAIFGGIDTGPLSVSAFTLGIAAADAADRIIYDQSSGSLWYDPDGSGIGSAVQFAHLDPGTLVAASDFFVI